MLNDVLKITVNKLHKVKCVVMVNKKEISADLEITSTSMSIIIAGEVNSYDLGMEIKGITNSGYTFITSAVNGKRYRISIPGITIEKYYFDHICFMSNQNFSLINKLQDFKIQEANISLSGLTNWLPHDIYKGGWPSIQGKFQEIKRLADPDKNLAKVTFNNINFELVKHEELRFIPKYNGLDINISEQLGVRCNTIIGLSQLSNISNAIRDLFSLIWTLPTNVMNINQIDRRKPIFNLLLNQRRTYNDQNNQVKLFKFKTYGCLSRSIRNYFRLQDTPLKGLINEYLNVMRQDLDTDMQLIELCQGIESLIREDLHLQQKIKRVMKPFAKEFDINNEELEEFTRKIKNNRVNITHGENKQIVFTNNNFTVAVRTLMIACQFYIFKRLDISDDYKEEFSQEINNIKNFAGISPISLFTLDSE